MKDYWFSYYLSFVLGVLMGLAAGCIIGARGTELGYQTEAIEHGAAEYDQKTGEWKWKESVR